MCVPLISLLLSGSQVRRCGFSQVAAEDFPFFICLHMCLFVFSCSMHACVYFSIVCRYMKHITL